MKNVIRQIYFYAATLIFLVMSVIALISLLNLGLKTYVFTKAEMAYDPCVNQPTVAIAPPGTSDFKAPTAQEQADQQARCEKQQVDQRDSQRQNTLVQYLSMLLVAAPLFFLHFRWVQKDRELEIRTASDVPKQA